jgi:DNA repair protein RadC
MAASGKDWFKRRSDRMTSADGGLDASKLMAVNEGSVPWIAENEPQPLEAMPGPIRASEGAPGDRVIALMPENGKSRGYLKWLSEPDALNAVEVLELLLQYSPASNRAVGVAAHLLDRFGSLGGVLAADPARLSEVLGGDGVSVMLLKAVRAAVRAIVREPLEDRPVIGSASALMDYLTVTMRHEPTEATRLLYLDRKNALIKDEIQHRGTVDHTPVYPREIVKRVVELGACAVILVHNRLTGDPTPSPADIAKTRQLSAALATIGVVLHDHVIISRITEASFRKLNLL